MAIEYKHLSMLFSDPDKLPEGINRFGYILYKSAKDKKDLVILHLLHGTLHLLSNVKVEWDKLKHSKYAKVLKKTSGESASVDSEQINVQLALDCVLYIVYRIAEHMGDELSDSEIKDIIHSIIGLSVNKLQSWTGKQTQEGALTIYSSIMDTTLSNIQNLKKL